MIGGEPFCSHETPVSAYQHAIGGLAEYNPLASLADCKLKSQFSGPVRAVET